MLRSLRTRLTVAAVLVAAAPLLASCGSDRSAAATVGDETISVNALQDDVLALRDAYGAEAVSDGATVQRSILQQAIVLRLLERVADDNGVTVTGREVEELIDLAVEENGGDREAFFASRLLTEDTVEDAAWSSLAAGKLADQLGQEGRDEAAVAAGEELGVSVNRRYGTWDPELLQITGTTGSIATAPLEPALDVAPE